MPEENINQGFRLKKMDEIRNRFIEEINRNELMSKKPKNVCRVLNYIEHSFIVISTINGCVSISAFASLVSIHIGITNSATKLKIQTTCKTVLSYCLKCRTNTGRNNPKVKNKSKK